MARVEGDHDPDSEGEGGAEHDNHHHVADEVSVVEGVGGRQLHRDPEPEMELQTNLREVLCFTITEKAY